MIGFSNFDNLISLCGGNRRIGSSFFASSRDGGDRIYTAENLANAMGGKITGDKKVQIKTLIADSRRVSPAAAFFAVGGFSQDGNHFVEEATHRGAVVVVSEKPAPKKFFPATWIEVDDIRNAMSIAATDFYAHPSSSMKVYAVTGTNGKTTVSWLVQKILNDVNSKCGLIGTIHYDLGGRCLPASRTTPEPLELQAMLEQMRFADCKNVAMEISSHAISQKRAMGITPTCAAFTNLTQDHLDYHKSIDSYFETKASMFTGALGGVPQTAVLNFDDPYGRKIAEKLSAETKLVSFGIESKDADIRAEDLNLSSKGSEFTLVYPEGRVKVKLNMAGHYNALNALTVLAMVWSQGVSMEDAAHSLENFRGVPGRMEKVNGAKNFDIFVDYAHTDDALKNGLSMLRKIVKGRLLVVFGCGGKRDRTKRPKMTSVVQQYADIAWATSDNPRGEELENIFADMKEGVVDASRIAFIEDRRRAINLAIDAASDGDCILIAGKGHETFQELGDTIIPFDDRRVAEELLSLKGII